MPTRRAKAQVSTFKQAATNNTTSYANQQFILERRWDSRRVYFPLAIQIRCTNQQGWLFVLESIFSAKQSETHNWLNVLLSKWASWTTFFFFKCLFQKHNVTKMTIFHIRPWFFQINAYCWRLPNALLGLSIWKNLKTTDGVSLFKTITG